MVPSTHHDYASAITCVDKWAYSNNPDAMNYRDVKVGAAATTPGPTYWEEDIAPASTHSGSWSGEAPPVVPHRTPSGVQTPRACGSVHPFFTPSCSSRRRDADSATSRATCAPAGKDRHPGMPHCTLPGARSQGSRLAGGAQDKGALHSSITSSRSLCLFRRLLRARGQGVGSYPMVASATHGHRHYGHQHDGHNYYDHLNAAADDTLMDMGVDEVQPPPPKNENCKNGHARRTKPGKNPHLPAPPWT